MHEFDISSTQPMPIHVRLSVLTCLARDEAACGVPGERMYVEKMNRVCVDKLKKNGEYIDGCSLVRPCIHSQGPKNVI